ncbi:hypothetical protein BU25DRAFT_462778 [Macroventuria anomochaeta]|uniref:Uncharacterized protein n=1 Tax=Macroventuria anomochaeta TaxID=301207 RepID=A0ACB6RKG8_9PLEO|nr:uncharacterized protein BU25DRAFT_462778 [Macroventuria anomochaeta]KAF2622445.1 hypothetical protein BU25DRAFT_462778 [Macroventuria anomochaeta]
MLSGFVAPFKAFDNFYFVGHTGEGIKGVIITQEHLDHYGGAEYPQDRFGVKVYGLAPFWDDMALLPANATHPASAKGETLTDGQK